MSDLATEQDRFSHMFNRLFLEKLSFEEKKEKMNEMVAAFVHDVLKKHEVSIEVKTVWVEKIADLIRVHFTLSNGGVESQHVYEKREQDLLICREPITTLLSDALLKAVKEVLKSA